MSEHKAQGQALPVTRASSWARAAFWDQFLRLSAGGVGVVGGVPDGPAVVVANHSSHADTAALISVLGKQAPVLVVAGGDYWQGSRAWLARNVVGILPISRTGGYEALRDGAAEHLRAGGVLVIFPEGTRGPGGDLAPFKSGAARVAADHGVPLVPAGITGTAQLFGKGMRWPNLAAPRNHPLGVRIGSEVRLDDPTDREQTEAATTALRSQVAQLAALPAPPVTDSASWEWAETRLAGRRGAAFTFAWAFAEGLFFPIIAETGIVPVALVHGRRSAPAVGAAVAGSVTGVVVNWTLRRGGIRVPWPMTTPAMHEDARLSLQRDVATALREQRFNGIPVKVYARTAGALGLPLRQLLPATASARASRIVPVGAAAAALGHVGRRRIRVSYGALLTVSATGLAVGLEMVLRRWKPYR